MLSCMHRDMHGKACTSLVTLPALLSVPHTYNEGMT